MFAYSDDKLVFHHSVDTHPVHSDISNSAVHAHKKNEILYFISGKASYLVEGNVYRLQPGGIMIMRSGEFHKIQIDGDAAYERMALHFSDDIVSSLDPGGKLLSPFYDRELGKNNYFPPSEIRTGHIYECLKSIDSSPNDVEIRRIAITANLYSILYEIKMAYMVREKENRHNAKTNSLAGEMIEYINANLAGELSLEILSDKFFVSKNHLNRVFKKATGVTVWEYIKLKRLLFARASIMDGASAVSACESSGFKDYSAFYRAYKMRFGVSPKEVYRK